MGYWVNHLIVTRLLCFCFLHLLKLCLKIYEWATLYMPRVNSRLDVFILRVAVGGFFLQRTITALQASRGTSNKNSSKCVFMNLFQPRNFRDPFISKCSVQHEVVGVTNIWKFNWPKNNRYLPSFFKAVLGRWRVVN